MQNDRQSIWDSCALGENNAFEKNTSKSQEKKSRSGNTGRKLRNGELRLAVAKLIIQKPNITLSEIMTLTGVTKSTISYTIKKIREDGVPGVDEYLLERALETRDRAEQEAREQKRKEKEDEQRRKERERALREEELGREKDMQIFLRKQAKRSKRPATISTAGMADWNKMHYDPVTGMLQLDCQPPADLPRRYPRPQLIIMPDVNRQPEEIISANLPAKAQGTAAGRRRIGYMRMF